MTNENTATSDDNGTATLPWRDAVMDDAPVYLDADTANGWAMGYNAAREAFLRNRGALFDLAMSNLPRAVPARFDPDSGVLGGEGHR